MLKSAIAFEIGKMYEARLPVYRLAEAMSGIWLWSECHYLGT